MLKENDRIRLSASDLMRFVSCAHASRLELERLHGGSPEPAVDSEDAELLRRHGDAHEVAHLDALRASGDVIEIETEQPFPEAVEATRAALQAGPAIVFHGALEGGARGGWSDCLERVDVPSELGAVPCPADSAVFGEMSAERIRGA